MFQMIDIPNRKLRGLYLMAFWLLAASITMAVTPMFLEAGYDVTEEKIKATLMAPFSASLGMNYLLSADHRVTSLVTGGFVAFFVVMGLVLIFCRGRLAFLRLALLHLAIVPTAFVGFYRLTCYWNVHGHG